MKYLRFRKLGVVIFEEVNGHDEMAKLLTRGHDEVISAGFVNADDWADNGKVCVGGSSSSLEISSLPEDEIRVRTCLKR